MSLPSATRISLLRRVFARVVLVSSCVHLGIEPLLWRIEGSICGSKMFGSKIIVFAAFVAFANAVVREYSVLSFFVNF